MLHTIRHVVAALFVFAAATQTARPAMALQNWFGYGGIFGPQTTYTFYAPPPVTTGYATEQVVTYMAPTTMAPGTVVSYSGQGLVLPAVAYAPVTTYAPPTTCGAVPTCGTVCGPATFAPATTTVIGPTTVMPAAPTTVVPAAPTWGTPTFPTPGTFAPATPAPMPATRSPELPTSTTISPADQLPTWSGYAPIQSEAPINVPPPPVMGETAPSSEAAKTTPKSGASEAPASEYFKPDLDISVPEEEDLVPVTPPASKPKTETPAKDEAAETGPRLGPEDGNTAIHPPTRSRLLAPATWRAARPAARRAQAKPLDSAWRAAPLEK